MLALLPGLYLGWGIGAHDAANTFGPQVGAGVISYRRAIALAALFAFLGAVLEGHKVFPTLAGVTTLTLRTSIAASLVAAVTVNLMTRFGLPISTSHTIVGALVAVGIFEGAGFDVGIVARVATSMVAAPFGAGVLAHALYRSMARAVDRWPGKTLNLQRMVQAASIFVGCYASYALGSNHVGNAMAPFVAIGVIGPGMGAALGGLAIAVGVLTYSQNLIMVIGKRITALDPISALVAVMGAAVTVHVFTQLAIPVSTSQAIVGAVVGVGLTKGMMAVNRRMFWLIPAGWISSILGTGLLTYLLLLGYAALR
jgi:PiT family inorganic phosphate transporter